jgi:hypothetical protein
MDRKDTASKIFIDGTVLPPGKHPADPAKNDIDPLAFALVRLQTMLNWVEEHLCSYLQFQNSASPEAQSELHNLKDALSQSRVHLQRASELVLSGYTIDCNKEIPSRYRQARPPKETGK